MRNGNQVECKRTSLNLGDVFILDLGSNVYVWMPPESGRLERIKGMDQARNIRDMRGGKVQVHGLGDDVYIVYADWNTNEEFWSQFGGAGNLNDIKSAKAGGDDENLWRPQARKIVLWRVSDESGKMKITKVSEGSFKRRDLESKGKPEWTGVVRVLDGHEPATFTQWASAWEDGKTKRKDLDGDDVMIVDNFDVIYVWIGANANANEKKFAGQLAQKYLASDTLPRPPSAVIKTLHQNRETSEFKRLFPDWA
ncbi:unnamed protein product [Anisakis simplex]|uniref:Gelsolin-like protein 1 (inferred by orthology to a C. elegans protein) n=1 Tax=Anisakis simplex TaxID=6269 RepID=A0A0M3K507_ANISI|nr:unnamed protein product [Anisakis simplex]